MRDRIVCQRGSRPPVISITQHGQFYLITFPYNQEVLDLFKRHIIPAHRTFNPNPKGWLIHPDSIDIACQQLEAVYGGSIKRPEPINGQAEITTETFRVEYIGACKDRGQGKSSAYGAFAPKQWGIEFPEDVLKKFFGGVVELGKVIDQTCYQVLLLAETANPQQIKQAYRRMALQWHPDKCKEPEAHERFMEIDRAYKLLSDPIQKKKYDAGLYFERQTKSPRSPERFNTWNNRENYRAPLISGLITVVGVQGLGRFVVSEILKWEDIRDNNGKVCVSSWPLGAEAYQIAWV
jgi:hypothetical protein